MKKLLRHVMIDIETMGVSPSSAIVSIGAVLFDPRHGAVSDKFYYSELDWKNQNRRICAKTKKWWRSQSRHAQSALHGIDDLDTSLIELSAWLPPDCKIWGNGPTFDISILQNAYLQFKLPTPWKFWNIRDVRTIVELFEASRGGFNRASGAKGANSHNALEDAIRQAKLVTGMWGQILGDRGVKGQ